MASPLNPNQLKMFMTPGEIQSQYQPLDGDRKDRYGLPSAPDRTGYTHRPENTAGEPNWKIQSPDNDYAKGRPYAYNPGMERDDEVWSRKNTESKLPANEYRAEGAGGEQSESRSGPDWDKLVERSDYPQMHTGHTSTWEAQEYDWAEARGQSFQDKKVHDSTPQSSLYESVKNEGVQHPVHLGAQFGESGKPMVVGGHHRIAAAAEARPDDLLPVVHHEDFKSAYSNSSGGYEYR